MIEIFESINMDLGFTIELETDFPGRWLQTLDTQLKMMEDGSIEYQFYEKSMSSNFCIRRSSALSWNMKTASLSNEVRRRCLNTSLTLDHSVLDSCLLKFWEKMLRSGYTRPEATKILKSGLLGFERLRTRTGGEIHRN